MMDTSSKEYVELAVSDSYSNSEAESRGQGAPQKNPVVGGIAVVLLKVGSLVESLQLRVMMV
jgi:hypothetical protein